MPANRSSVSRDVKVEEVIAAARDLFLSQGYEATTMAAVAREVGIAPNVVFWYFASKDHLFVAVLEQGLDERIEAAQERSLQDLEEAITSFVVDLLHTRHVIADVHARAERSPVVAEYHDRTHRRYAELVIAGLAERGVEEDERALTTEVFIASIESLVTHGATPDHARETVAFLLRRLLGP